MTPTKKLVVSLIHQGFSNLQIVAEVERVHDLLGNMEGELLVHIEATRREIVEFRAQAPALAELGFQNGYGWPEVVAAIESPGLLSSFEVTQICVRARNKVQAKTSDQTLPEIDNDALNQRLINEALKQNPKDSVLQGTLKAIREEQAEREERGL